MQETTISEQSFEQLHGAAKETGRSPEANLGDALESFIKDNQ